MSPEYITYNTRHFAPFAEIEEGFPYVDGYKPLGNYQDLLRDIAMEQVQTRPDLVATLTAQVDALPQVPEVDDILRSWVERPPPLGLYKMV